MIYNFLKDGDNLKSITDYFKRRVSGCNSLEIIYEEESVTIHIMTRKGTQLSIYCHSDNHIITSTNLYLYKDKLEKYIEGELRDKKIKSLLT